MAMAMAFWILVLQMPCAIEAELTTMGGTGVDRFVSSTFRYYGRPAHDQSIYDAQAVFLSGSEICNPLQSVVGGKIVFSDQSGAPCRLDHIYLSLSKAGALGFVWLGFSYTPGFLCYLHHTWDPNKYARRQMLMVMIGS